MVGLILFTIRGTQNWLFQVAWQSVINMWRNIIYQPSFISVIYPWQEINKKNRSNMSNTLNRQLILWLEIHDVYLNWACMFEIVFLGISEIFPTFWFQSPIFSFFVFALPLVLETHVWLWHFPHFFSSEKHFQRMNRLLQVGSLDVAWSYGSVKNIQTNLFS